MEEKLYELRRDIFTPACFIPAGIKKTEKEWKDRLGNISIRSQWFIDLDELKPNPIDELKTLIDSVFSSYGLNSLTYKDAAREIAELWLKQNTNK